MLNEEEKKAIEKLKEYALCKVNDNGYVEVSANGYNHTILNLIEGLQTKVDTGIEIIKELKEIEKTHKEENGKLREEIIRLDNVLKAKKQEIAYLKIQIPSDRIFYFSDKDYISKDKIKEIIKDDAFEIYTKEYGNINVVDINNLEELLEEK